MMANTLSFLQAGIPAKNDRNISTTIRMKNQVLALSLIFICSIQLFGQQKVVTLNTRMTGTHDVVARDAVILAPGFRYRPSSGSTFIARTDENLVVHTGYLSGDLIPDPDNRPLNTSLQVGSTTGSISNSQIGGLSYTVPLFCSPGTNGVQPSLSLQYNSQSGNGSLGWGWNLGGFSSVSRIVKPYYIDNNIKAIEMSSDDEYAIDGNRLVLITGTGSQGTDGSKYNTESETFSETIAHGATGSGPAWFEVKNKKDGSVLEYGNADNAYLQNAQNTRLTWFLTKFKDANGNYIKYNYLQDPGSGQTYLHSIQYTGNDNAGLQPYNEIIIQYERRTDAFKNYQTGVEITNGLLISKIVIACQGITARIYEFDYKYDLYSFLAGVRETTGNGATYNSTIFEYNDVPQSFSNSSFLITTGKNEFNYADFNGDGRSDLAVIPVKEEYSSSDKIKIYTNLNGTVFQFLQDINIDPYTIDLGDDGSYYFQKFSGSSAVDFNGDGNSDFYTVETRDNSLNPYWSPEDNPDRFQNIYKFYLSDGINLISSNMSPASAIWSMVPGDIDGDGMSDLFYFTPGADQYRIEFSRNISEGFTLSGSIVPGSIATNSEFTGKTGPVDFNGDGKTEIFSIDINSYMHIYGYNNSLLTELIEPFYFNYETYCFGDINGDGKTDIFGYKDNECKIFFSDGKMFRITDFSPDYRFSNEKFSIADLNGDGKGDLAQEAVLFHWVKDEDLKQYVNKYQTTLYVHYYNGNDFTSEVIDVSTNDSDLHNLFFSDFNGDGQNELYFRPVSLGIVTNSIIYGIRPDDKSRLLSTISNGFNNKCRILYGILPKTSSYSKTTNRFNFPVRKLSLPIYLVENIRLFGSGEATPYSNTNYFYQDLAIHMQGKGLLGFSKFTSENLVDLSRSEVSLSFGTTFFNVYPAKTKQYIDNTLVSETTNAPAVNSLDNGKRFFPYIYLSTTEDKVNNIIAEVSTTIDPSGNLTAKSTKAKTSSGTLVSQISESYTNHNEFGNPLNASVTSTRGAESISRSKISEYYPDGLLKKETKYFGSSPSVETSFTYDGFGNVLTSSVTSGSETRTSTFTYESEKNRFVKTRTNPLGYTITYNNDPVTGNITEEFDHTNLKTSYIFDGFGKNIEIRYPDGQTIHNKVGWSLNMVGKGELYYSESESANKPAAFTYYDFLGRELRSKAQSFDGTYLVSDKEYDTNGRIEKSYMPYYEGNTPERYIAYSYDALGRINSETIYPGGATTSYTYNNLKTIINKSGLIYEKENDASGLLYKSTDPGGSITYNYDAEGKTKSIISPSGTTSIDYDDYGYQDMLHDIDAKTIDYDYNGFGELIKQVDAEGNQSTMLYDALGRINSKTWLGGETSVYTYYPETGLLSGIALPGRTQSFTYDNYYRISSKTETVDNNTFTAVYTYDSYGNITEEKLNNDVTLSYVFNGYGYLDQVKADNQLVWDANSMNEYGQIDNYTLGDNANTVVSYDQNGFVDKKETKIGASWIQNWDYDFDPLLGNLTKRRGIKPSGGFLEETFTYDNLNRLLTYTGGNNLSVSYDPGGKGNISTKSDIGSYNYSSLLVHRLDSITNLSENLSGLPKQNISYTKFSKVSTLTHPSPFLTKQVSFTYGTDEQRVKTIYTINSNTILTKYYALGNYEKEIAADNTYRELYYILTPTGVTAILEKKDNQANLYYIHTDLIGSFDVVTNSSGAILEQLSFDPWGRRRNPNDWTYTDVPSTYLFDRGFTGHEHLDNFDLINMNGRVYDPLLAMFLSPDNYVQAPDFTQNFNRYSYCLNNPLIYTDPDGEWFITALVTLANMWLTTSAANDWQFNPVKWDWSSAKTWVTLGQSAFTGYKMGSGAEKFLKEKYLDFRMKRLEKEYNSGINQYGGYTASVGYGGEIVQSGGIFVKDETLAYNYMWENATSLKKEYGAFITPNGVLILPTDLSTEYSASLFDYYPTSWEDKSLFVMFKNKHYQIIGALHTHQAVSSYGYYFSGNDSWNTIYMKGLPHMVINYDNTAYAQYASYSTKYGKWFCLPRTLNATRDAILKGFSLIKYILSNGK